MKTLCHILSLFWIGLLLAAIGTVAHAQEVPSTDRVGVAVLVDVSKSMSFNTENWKTEVRTSLNTFISGGTLDENVWRVDGEADAGFVKKIRNGTPIYVPPSPLVMAEVGAINDTYPFLKTIELRTPQTLNDAASFVRGTFPQAFQDQWTYLEIGHAIVRDRMLEQGALQWYVLQISDEDQDFSDVSKTPEAARRLANGFKANLLIEEPLALSFREDTRLRMKLFRYTSKVDPCASDASRPLCKPDPEPTASQSSGSVRLRSPRSEETVDAQPVEFRWTSSQGLDRFDLTLRAEDGELVNRTRTTQRRLRMEEDLDAGAYTWQVIGYGEAGRVQSSPQTFAVSESGGGALWWILGMLGLLGGGAYAYNYYYNRNQRRASS